VTVKEEVKACEFSREQIGLMRAQQRFVFAVTPTNLPCGADAATVFVVEALQAVAGEVMPGLPGYAGSRLTGRVTRTEDITAEIPEAAVPNVELAA